MKTFKELFENALFYDKRMEQPKNEFHKATEENYYNLAFNIWLQENKGWEYGNEKQYIELLTKENWKAFRVDELSKGKAANEKHELEKQSWQIETEDLTPQQNETKTEQEQPKTFEELFYNPENAEPCLKILSELQPPFIDAINNYIGKGKGVFPLWVKVLKNHKPKPLIKHFKDTVYKDLLNQKVKGLNLTKDASEFRKQYIRLENDKIELDIKTILSQYSQNGKLGK